MKKILILRSSKILFNKLMTSFSLDESIEVTALVASSVVHEELSKMGVKNIIVLPAAKGFRLQDMWCYYMRSRREYFDEIICLYNNESGYGYLNVDLFSVITRGKKRIALNYQMIEKDLSVLYLVTKFIRVSTGWCWIVVNSSFFLLLYVLTVVGMTIVEGMVLLEKMLSHITPDSKKSK